MKATVAALLLSTVLCAGVDAVALADAPPLKPLVINPSGTFQDKGVWLYRNANGLFGFGPAILGTNEMLVMPAPSPEPGGSLAGVEILRHPSDTLGYPLHVALVEKLFAASYQTPIIASDNNGVLWQYEYGNPVFDEKPLSAAGRPTFKTWGPYHADAVPISQAPEPDIQAAFTFAKGALNLISNLPDSQKSLANYGVLFVDDGTTVWVEFGPRFSPNEAPHLGCQTQLGRDMVFGFSKKQSGDGQSGRFLQCF